MNPNSDALGGSVTAALSQEARTFNWLLDAFTAETAGVIEAVAVSSDGLLMAMSAVKDRARAERLAAVVSGLISLAGGASVAYEMGVINRIVIDMAEGYLLVTAISAGSVLGVMADPAANLSTMAYEMTLFASKAGTALTPHLINELKNSIGS
jgi:predicted regulator of Ras-like GTPase activity (Roadblock/LC7/MglB family)